MDGIQLAEVRDEITSGRWIGLATLYAKSGEPDRIGQLLPSEWRISRAGGIGCLPSPGWAGLTLSAAPAALIHTMGKPGAAAGMFLAAVVREGYL